jgi:hypothetical protein
MTEYAVAVKGDRIFTIKSATSTAVKLNEDVNKVKLVAVVQKLGEDLVLMVGPIFDYWEKK